MTEAEQADLGRQTTSGLSWQMLGSVLRAMSSFAFGVVLARLLTPEDFGVVAMASLATSFAYVVADLGLASVIIQRKELTDRHVRVASTLSVAVALLITAVLYFSSGGVSRFFGEPRLEPVLRVLALSFLFSGFGITAGALLLRRLAFKTLFRIELATSVVGYGLVGVSMALAEFGYWSLVGATVAQAGMSSALMYWAAKHPVRPLVAATEVRQLAGFSAGVSMTFVVNYVALKGDYLVVGKLLDATSVGLYSRAYALMELPLVFVGNSLSRVLFPAAARVQDETQRFRRAYLSTLSVAVAVSVPASVALVVMAPELIVTLYGPSWVGAAPLLQILAGFGMFRMTYNTASTFVRARGRVYQLLWSTIVYAALVVGGSWFGAQELGVHGVAWAVGVALTVMWILVLWAANRTAEVSVVSCVRTLVSASLPGVTIGAVLWVVVSTMRAMSWPPPVILVSAGALFGVLLVPVLIAQLRGLKHAAIDSIIDGSLTAGARFRRRVAGVLTGGTA